MDQYASVLKPNQHWAGGRGGLNEVCLRRTQLSHTTETSIKIVSSVLLMVQVDTAAIQFSSACTKAFCLKYLKELSENSP